MSTSSTPAAGALSHFDARPFFEKALRDGLEHGLIGQGKLDAMSEEAPKGMVQIARYFGSEYLRPELERARERLVNLVSLHLQHATQGDVRAAAQLLRDNTLLSRSKAGADLLKAMIVMPQNTHFGMNERGAFSDRHIGQLARWSLAPYSEVQAELAARQHVAQVVQAALWLAARLGLDADALQDCEPDAEAVIRSALLVRAMRRKELPDWHGFEQLIAALRKKEPAKVIAALTPPADLPADLRAPVQGVCQSVLADLPKLLDARLPVRRLFDQTPAFMGRYFWLEDALGEITHFDQRRSKAWDKITQGHADDGTLLTLLLCVAAGATPKTLLTDKAAATLIRKLRKTGFQPALASTYLAQHAPEQHQDDYQQLWNDFVLQAQPVLLSDRDTQLIEALALLRRECNVV